MQHKPREGRPICDLALAFAQEDVPITEINSPNDPLSEEEREELANRLRANVSRA